MAPNNWAGESQSSIAFSMNPRDSRVVSIYDKYLYDPKDLESSDPRRRELARKASQLKLHGRPANHLDANGLRSVGPSNTPPSQRKSIAFSQNTKLADGNIASSHNAGVNPSHHSQHRQRHNHRPSYADASEETHDRDSGAFGLGLGMLGGSDSESYSDSDDGHPAPRNPALDKLKHTSNSDRPDSWTDRANAVGHRPPDHASQNPPSLKLMVLKSAKERADLSASSQDERNSRLAVDTNFVDRTSRHGSTIGFAAHPMESQTTSSSAEAANGSKRLSARTALTKQLGLASPNPEPAGASSNRAASPNQRPGPQDYFDYRVPNATRAASPPRHAGPPPPIDVYRAQQPAYGPQGGRGVLSPIESISSPNSATPLRSPGYGPGGIPSPNHPQGQGHMPPSVLQRGPPSPNRQPSPQGGPGGPNGPGNFGRGNQQSYNAGPTRPGPGHGQENDANSAYPSSLQAGGARPPPNNMSRVPGPQGQNGPPGPNSNFGPSFSDAPGPSKRQSIFRRSMAMFGVGPQAGPAGNGYRPNNPPRAQAPQKRQSLFRRSMAMLTGGNGQNNNGGAPPQQGGQQMRMPAPAVSRAPQAPRVQGLQGDYEKPDHPRKSQFLGAGGEGAEWDTNGEGAKFWRRFSMAQKNAGSHKLEDGSRAWMASMASGRRKLIIMGIIALVSLVGIIASVIAWREIVSPSGSPSGEPSSIYKANLGAKGSASSSTLSSATSTSKKAKATATSTGSSSYYSRSLPAEAIAGDLVKRHQRRAAKHELGAQKMRKHHFGRAFAAASPQTQASLDELD